MTYLTVKQAATRLNVSKWTIYRWIHDGRLKASKLSPGTVRIKQDDVDALVANTEVTA